MQLLKPIQSVLEYVVVFLYKNVTTNYGLVIILLTIIVRMILTPLTITQTRSMVKMQKLQPQLKEIQKKYKDDKQKLQQETMEFYRKNNVNPLAGCLPLLFQMPVFYALFQALRTPSEIITSVLGNFYVNGIANGIKTGLMGFLPALNYTEFLVNGASNPNYNFLWMNLNARDPYYILVILMVVTMFISTRMTTTDPNQSKIMYIMPLVFGFMSFQFPSGILVYWVTSNVWSIGQQWVVNKIVSKQRVKEELEQEKEKLAKKDEIGKEKLKKIIKKKKKRKKRK